MDEAAPDDQSYQIAGVSIWVDRFMPVWSLRCFKQDSLFVEEFVRFFHVEPPTGPFTIPLPLLGPTIAAWRSPTEILIIGETDISQELAGWRLSRAMGCCLDIRGQYAFLLCHGNKMPDLLSRLGGTNIVPKVGDAKRCRLADLPAMITSTKPDAYEVLIERPGLAHLEAALKQVGGYV